MRTFALISFLSLGGGGRPGARPIDFAAVPQLRRDMFEIFRKNYGSREPGKWVITNQSAAAARFHTGHALPEFSALTILFREDNIHPLQLNHPK